MGTTVADERLYGVVVGTVVDVEDDQGEGRVRVRFDWMGDQAEGYWAPVAVLMAGSQRGTWFRPRPDDEVLCAFLHGDKAHPYIVGYLWNGDQRPPESDPDLRVIFSENGHTITLADPGRNAGDMGYVRIADAHGNYVELSNGSVRISSVGSLEITAPNVTINNRPVLPYPWPI